MKKFVTTDKYSCINTTIMIPHLECYLIRGNDLIAEQIDGKEINLGNIVCSCNNKLCEEGANSKCVKK